MLAPVMAVGDGALGFWAAVREVWPETRAQACWVHKLANVLDKLTKRLQPRAKRALHEMMYALAIVFFWPRSIFSTRLITLATVLGTGAALVCGLTYWHKARVQIGRRGLRFKVVRRTAGVTAGISLSFLFVWMVAYSIALVHVKKIGPGMWAISLESNLPIAIAHLQGDEGHQIEDALVRGLKPSESKLPISIIRVDQTFEPKSPVSKPFNNLDVADALRDHRAYLMLWGAVDKNTRVIRLYETGVTPGAQFGSTYLTADFKLPELPVEELVPVLWLILASQSRYIRPIDEKAGRYLTQSAT